MVRFARMTIRLTAGLLAVVSAVQSALAQCAMCRASIANSDNPAEVSSSVNAGILVLLLPTLALIVAIVTLVARYHRLDSQNGSRQ